jgi:hypothetical protein
MKDNKAAGIDRDKFAAGLLPKQGGGPLPPSCELSVTIDSPSTGSKIDPSNGPIIINGSYDITGCILKGINVQINNGRPLQATTVQRAWSFSLSPTSTGDIIAVATIEATQGKKIKSNSVTIHIEDHTNPILTIDPIISSIPLEELENTINITGTASDYFGIGDIQVNRVYNDASPESIAPVTRNNPPNWSATLTIGPRALGTYKINAICTDSSGNRATQSVSFNAVDVKPPRGHVDEPSDGRNYLNFGGGATINVRGWSEDANSGMQKVEWSINGQSRKQANTSDNWAHWSDSVVLKDNGEYRLDFFFTDNANLSWSESVTVTVSAKYKPKGLADLLSIRAYLDDLISFATANVKINSTTLLTKQNLEAVFFQPFDALANPFPASDWGNKQVNQIRVSMETLIRYLKSLKLDPDTDPNFKAARSRYLHAAYYAILDSIGTSYEEIRLVRSAPDNVRRALAARLGINLGSIRPDQIDQLFLKSDQQLLIKPLEKPDQKLEDLFGLVNIMQDPWKVTPLDPKVLKWQIDSLRTTWKQQDYMDQSFPPAASTTTAAPSAADVLLVLPSPLIDPDIIDIDDLANAISNDPAFKLLNSRKGQVADKFSSLKGKRERDTNDIQGLTDIINSTIILPDTLIVPTTVPNLSCNTKGVKPFDFLACLQQYQNNNPGIDIKPILDQMYLTMDMFSYLLRIKSLAESKNVNSVAWDSTITDLEWENVYNVLTQVYKKQQYIQWKKEEKAYNISLTQDYFEISSHPYNPVQWRSSEEDRQKWQDVLQGRIDQEQSVKEEFYSNIQSAEEEVLPVFGDDLVSIVKTIQNLSDASNYLTNMLLIDMKDVSYRATTRINQAAETLQNILFSLRTKRFDPSQAAYTWTISGNEDKFDEQWKWIGSYATWRAATLVIYYPENILLPSLRTELSDSSAIYNQWITTQRKEHASLTAEEARTQANVFLDAILKEQPLPTIKNQFDVIVQRQHSKDPTFTQFKLTELNTTDDRLKFLRSACRYLMSGNEIGHWKFDDVVGTSASDSSGYENNATLLPLSNEKTHPNGPTWSTDGKVDGGQSLMFDGVDDYAQVNDTDILHVGKDNSDFTVTFWIKLLESFTGQFRCIMHKGSTQDTERTFGLWMRPTDNRIHYRISTATNKNNGVEASAQEIKLNEWMHIAYVKSEAFLQLFINGNLDSQLQLTEPTVDNSGPIYIGKDPWFAGTKCQLDDIRIYDRGLNIAELSTIAGGKGLVPPSLNYFKEIFYFVPMQLAIQLQKSGEYIAALDWYQTVYAYNLPADKSKIFLGLELERNLPPNLPQTQDWLLESLNPHTRAANMPNPYTRFTLMNISRCFMEFADLEFSRTDSGSTSRARSLYLTASRLLSLPDIQTPTLSDPNAIILPNPVLDALIMHVETSISKLRQGRMFNGMKRQVANYVSSSSTMSSATTINADNQMPDINVNGDVISTSSQQLRAPMPTPYKYNVLIERSKQLVNIAQQIEATYLSALEKRDSENYNLMKARFDLDLTESNKQLQDMKVNEALDNVELANKQRARITDQQNTYDTWIHADLNDAEQKMIDSYIQVGQNKINAEFFGMLSQIAGIGISLAGSSLWGAPAAMVAAALQVSAVQAQTAFTSQATNYETQAQVSSVWASYESRQQQWQLQKALLNSDVGVSEQQIIIAQDSKSIAEKESAIANTQTVNNKAVVDFLANKFTNADLYDWMSGVLSGVYRYFLLQATSVAFLAQNQLAFERQERPPNFIRSDYWQPQSEQDMSLLSGGNTNTGGSSNGTSGSTTDRRGLTGSARLLQDIYQLDQFAFDTNKRKLNLVHTFSLAQLFPFEFQQFRETGVMNFVTPMSEFDRRFPGHYLRLIKRIRTSIIALIPPIQGISATLSTTGISHVVIADQDIFKTTDVVREPESVALTSPTNATGIFEMDIQPDMLLPFESMGVETAWQLQMPKAANPFDFSTIADVFITIEYTALNSFDYRQQVLKNMNNKIGGDRKFSFKDQFPDQWYQLQNPDQIADGGKQMVVNFDVSRDDFPVNVENLKLENVLIYIPTSSIENGAVPSELTVRLAQDQSTSAEDEATSVSGVISTRRGSWPKLRQEKSPVGKWELSFMTGDPVKNAQVMDKFRNGNIEDIMIILTYKGNTPKWPV